MLTTKLARKARAVGVEPDGTSGDGATAPWRAGRR